MMTVLVGNPIFAKLNPTLFGWKQSEDCEVMN